MEKIYSKIHPDCLCHVVHRLKNFKPGRVDLIDEGEYLQVATLRHDKGKTFKPHRHIQQQKVSRIAQESWVVLQGKVKCIFYDIEGTNIIATKILQAGDCSLTLCGGHNYVFMERDTRVLEYKSGPYLGQERDKVFI